MQVSQIIVKMYLLNLSGGVDSVYTLWRWLENNPKDKLLVHHILLKDQTNRWVKEKECVDKVLEYFKDYDIEYLESEFKDPTNEEEMAPNCIIEGAMSSIILRVKDVDTIIMTSDKEDMENTNYANYRRKILLKLIEVGSRKRFKTIYPSKEKTKVDMIKEFPQELFNITWWCRKGGESYCGECASCKRIGDYLNSEKVKRWVLMRK